MEFSQDDLRLTKEHLANRASSSYAPQPVIEAVLTLASTVEPIAGLADSTDQGEDTRWRALWLVEGALVYVDALRRGDSMWDLAGHIQEAHELTGWRRRLSDVDRIEIRKLSSDDLDFGTSWTWRVAETIIFKDGTEVAVPLIRDLPHSNQATSIEHFMGELKSRL